MSSICKGCGAKVRWVKTANGNRMPLDLEPVATNVMVEFMGSFVLAPKAFVSHFATCPQADKFRGKGKNP